MKTILVIILVTLSTVCAGSAMYQHNAQMNQQQQQQRQQQQQQQRQQQQQQVSGNLMASPASAQSKIDWIDVHVHLIAAKGALDDFDEAARAALQIMDDNNIKKIIVMSPPRSKENFDIESLTGVMAKYSARIAVMCGGGSLNPMLQEAGHSTTVSKEVRERFEKTAETCLASGAKGFGEMTAHHVSMAPSHGYDSVPADHPLLLLLADIAARHGVPIDLHFDPAPQYSDRHR